MVVVWAPLLRIWKLSVSKRNLCSRRKLVELSIIFKHTSVLPDNKSRSVFRGARRIAKSDYYVRNIRSSVRLEQLGTNWTDLHYIWYSRIYWKYVKQIQDLLKLDENNGYHTRRPIYIRIIYLSILRRMGNVSGKMQSFPKQCSCLHKKKILKDLIIM